MVIERIESKKRCMVIERIKNLENYIVAFEWQDLDRQHLNYCGYWALLVNKENGNEYRLFKMSVPNLAIGIKYEVESAVFQNNIIDIHLSVIKRHIEKGRILSKQQIEITTVPLSKITREKVVDNISVIEANPEEIARIEDKQNSKCRSGCGGMMAVIAHKISHGY